MSPHTATPSRQRALIAAAVIGTFTCSQAIAARWVAIGGDKKASIEIDASSIERTDGKVRVWHRETYSPRRLQEAWAFTYASMKQYTEFQCDKRLAATLRRIYFAESGAELRSEGFDAKDTSPVVPDSPVEAAFAYACRKKQDKPAETARADAPLPGPAPEPAPRAGKKKNGKEESATPAPPPRPAAAWAYDGKLGPDKWARLDADYALCGSGKRQSPIDVRNTIRGDLPPLRIAYQPVALQLLDDGHGIVANGQGGGTLTVDGEEFELQAVRFRHPGEEVVGGKRAAMSVQFEHRAKSGRIAILAVPVQPGKEAHRTIRALWTELPLEQHRPSTPGGVKFDASQLLPGKRDYMTYSGSLTYPPCSEGVLWVIMKQPIQLAKEQIADFARIYKHNIRPAQPANGRVIKESR